ncbi:MAG TPA: AraC family transcriptional regulator [Cyclobacteriaceae bacterium]
MESETAIEQESVAKRSLNFKLIKPDKSLQDFVYCFSSLHNLSDFNDGIIIPNGRIDLIFSKNKQRQFRISLLGLETKPKRMPKQSISDFFSISFNPLAIEYVFQQPIADILNKGRELPVDFWGFSIKDLDDFKTFCRKASLKIKSLLPEETDQRKHKLFELIFATNGEISVKELSEEIHWSPRQINRYFNQQFGISLKAYCNILRFQASLPHIKAGRLSPQLNFTDQSHFIKEVRKLSGVSPKELAKNQNDRFLQFLAVDKK